MTPYNIDPYTMIRVSQVMLVVKNLPANAGDIRDKGSVLGIERCPRRGHGNLLQYSCLENLMDRGAGDRQSTGQRLIILNRRQ